MTNWLNPIDKITFQRAIKKRAPKFELKDGREFTLIYKEEIHGPERQEYVTFRPVGNRPQTSPFVPYGTMAVKKILDSTFIVDDD